MRQLFILLVALLLVTSPSDAMAKRPKHKKKGAVEAPEKKPEEKPLIDRDGLFHVYKTKQDWFLAIPDSLLGKDILAITRYVSTPANSGKFGGEQCNEQVVYFSQNRDSTLVLRSRMFVNLADSTDAISKAVTVSNENPVIGTFKIEENKDGMLKIKVTNFFREENALGLRSHTREEFGLGQLAGDLCYINDIQTFPTNTEVQAVKTYNSNNNKIPSAWSTGKITFTLNTSFILLPAEPMMPRYYDPRVGYFTHGFSEYSDDQQRVERKMYISRWRLEPKDEDKDRMARGELVEPKKPIVFYIDPATPKQWRKYLIQGVNSWQPAFEQAGFKNAIYGLEWPEENDSTMSMEDAQYSVIRYLASPILNAYGPHVSDPRTGEILESHIGWYHNVMLLLHDWYMVQASSIDEAARKMNYDEELMGQLISTVAAHEVGHTLGLRHNFGSSSTVPVDSLRNKAWVEKHGHTPSIMDYARFNYVAQPEDNISYAGIFPRVGDYDRWAIEWGYRPTNALDPDTDHALLEPATRHAQANKRLWWGDGEAIGNDPRRQMEDLSDDAVRASEYGVMNLKREIAQLDAWTREKKDLYGDDLPYMYNQMMTQYKRYIGHVARYIGGTYITWRTRDEGGTLYEPTPLAKQKAALDYLNRYLFTEPTWFRETAYAASLNEDPQNLTLTIAREGAATLNGRLQNLNSLYPAETFLNDVIRLIFSETASGKAVTKYREALQNALVDELIKDFKAENSRVRGAALTALKSLQQRAQSYKGVEAHSKTHYANMADLIARTLVVK